MARPRRFSDDQILDAACDLLADPRITRPTIADIGRAAGVHVGSIYVRFSSRDELLARLWLRSIQRFQAGILRALRGPDPLLHAALQQPTYCRANPTEARAMKMFNREQLLQTDPDELRAQISTVNDELNEALAEVIRRAYGRDDAAVIEWVRAAVIAIPYGLIRVYIARAVPIPEWVDNAVAAAVPAVLKVQPPRQSDA